MILSIYRLALYCSSDDDDDDDDGGDNDINVMKYLCPPYCGDAFNCEVNPYVNKELTQWYSTIIQRLTENMSVSG